MSMRFFAGSSSLWARSASRPKGGRSRNTGSRHGHAGTPARVALAARAPDSRNSTESQTHMSNFNLIYSISKRTPASPRILKEILEAQSAVNRACTWSHEQLSFSAPRGMGRPAFAFPFVKLGLASGTMNLLNDEFAAPAPAFPDAFAQGSTKVRDNLWNAHLVAAFLKHVSRMFPQLVFELRDEGGFVIPGSVWIRGGNVEANREFLNRERTRVLEMTGDPQHGAQFILAELQALAGNFFYDVPASEYMEMPEIQQLGVRWEQLEVASLGDVASHVVERATKAGAPVAA